MGYLYNLYCGIRAQVPLKTRALWQPNLPMTRKEFQAWQLRCFTNRLSFGGRIKAGKYRAYWMDHVWCNQITDARPAPDGEEE